MTWKAWRRSRNRRKQNKRKTQSFSFGDKATTVTGHHGKKYMAAKAAVKMHLTPEEAEKFMKNQIGNTAPTRRWG